MLCHILAQSNISSTAGSQPLHHWLLTAPRAVTLCWYLTMCAGPDFDQCFGIGPLCMPLEGKPLNAFESVRFDVLKHHPHMTGYKLGCDYATVERQAQDL